MPAFNFFQFFGANLSSKYLTQKDLINYKSSSEPTDDKDHTMATVVSLKFQANSKLLAGFWDAIENKMIY